MENIDLKNVKISFVSEDLQTEIPVETTVGLKVEFDGKNPIIPFVTSTYMKEKLIELIQYCNR